jgi:hypothetical protein
LFTTTKVRKAVQRSQRRKLICYGCSEEGHFCDTAHIPKEQKHKGKLSDTTIESQEDATAFLSSESCNFNITWILDCGASSSMTKSKDLLVQYQVPQRVGLVMEAQ